jgi:hypothetical protein
MACDHTILVSRNDQDRDAAFGARYHSLVTLVGSAVGAYSKVVEPLTCSGANERGVLADPGGKDQRFQTA